MKRLIVLITVIKLIIKTNIKIKIIVQKGFKGEMLKDFYRFLRSGRMHTTIKIKKALSPFL